MPKAPRLESVCRLYATGISGDEEHQFSERLDLQESRDKRASLFSGPDTFQELMQQSDLVSVAEIISECPDKVYVPAAGPSHGGQASD